MKREWNLYAGLGRNVFRLNGGIGLTRGGVVIELRTLGRNEKRPINPPKPIKTRLRGIILPRLLQGSSCPEQVGITFAVHPCRHRRRRRRRSAPRPSEAGSVRSHRKRNRSGDDEFTEGFSTMVEAMSSAAKSVERLVDVFCEPPSNPMTKVYEEVGKIDGLNENEILEASEIIMTDLVKVNLLFSMPDNMKEKWVKKLLQ